MRRGHTTVQYKTAVLATAALVAVVSEMVHAAVAAMVMERMLAVLVTVAAYAAVMKALVVVLELAAG